jgi:CBS domain containing-hemolysin-like protein
VNGAGGLLVAVLLLLVNAFFVAAEFALISTRRSSIEPLAAQGSRRARVTLAGMEQASLLLAGSQLGITLASLGLGAVAEPSVAHELERLFDAVGAPDGLLHPVSFVIALLIVVFLHVVVGETIPKNLAIAGPERAALFLVPALTWLVRLLRPAIAGLNALANLTLRAVRITPQEEVTSAFTREEVAGMIAESHEEGLLDADDHEHLSDALGFDARTARAVLLPLEQLVTVSPGVTPQDVEKLSADTGFSRFPVRDSSGDLAGYVHLKDVLETDPVQRSTPVAAKRIRPLLRIGADDSLGSVLAAMQTNGAHLARATDAAGQLLGVVALEDVLAELIGETAS